MTATTVARGAARAPVIAPRRSSPPARRAHLRVVRTPARSARRARRRVVSAVSVTVLTILTVVAFHVLLAQSQIALDRLERRTAAAEARYQQVRLEHDGQTSPNRVVPKANELGLTLPNQPPTAVQVPSGAVPEPHATTPTLEGAQDVKKSFAVP